MTTIYDPRGDRNNNQDPQYGDGGVFGGPQQAPTPAAYGSGTAAKSPQGTGFTDSGAHGTAGKMQNDSAYGGYRGVSKRNPDGTWSVDWTQSGRADDERYYQGLGEAYSKRQAYQNDFTGANQDRERALQARGMQDQAIDYYRRTARGEDSRAQVLGRQMLNNAAQQQQGAAVSGGGDALARASALRQQQMGQGAFMSRGTQVLQGQKADEMARAREGWMQAQTQQRQDDMSGQTLAAQQAQIQAQSEIEQRKLNDEGQYGAEALGYDVNSAAQQGALANMGVDTTRMGTKLQSDAANQARDYRYASAGIGLATTGGAGLIKGSDERMKQDVRGLGHVYTRRW